MSMLSARPIGSGRAVRHGGERVDAPASDVYPTQQGSASAARLTHAIADFYNAHRAHASLDGGGERSSACHRSRQQPVSRRRPQRFDVHADEQRAQVTEGARGHRDAPPAHGLARVSSAASLAARHPTSGTTRETHRASRRTPPLRLAQRDPALTQRAGAPRRHTMPSAQAVVKRGSGARRTSVSQSWKVTGHFVRLYLRPRCPGSGHNRRIL